MPFLKNAHLGSVDQMVGSLLKSRLETEAFQAIQTREGP